MINKKYKDKIGFTNKLAMFLIGVLFLGLIGGFVLAFYSIYRNYLGALACYTVVFTPIGTALSIVLAKIVDKSREENTGATAKTGEGINYMLAKKATETKRQVNNYI